MQGLIIDRIDYLSNRLSRYDRYTVREETRDVWIRRRCCIEGELIELSQVHRKLTLMISRQHLYQRLSLAPLSADDSLPVKTEERSVS